MSIDTRPAGAASDCASAVGAFVFVVGPSGAGKDTLLDGARARLADEPRFIFPRRVVTRPTDTTENHISMGVTAFLEAREQGAFVFSWQAHGLYYGIPSDTGAAVRSGSIVVVNCSRRIIPEARQRYPDAKVVLVDCPPELRAERLALRGRESREDIESRITRTVELSGSAFADAIVQNDGPPEKGIATFVATLRRLTATGRAG